MKIDKLNFEIARLRRRKFEAKTEAMTAQQRALFAETLIEDEDSLAGAAGRVAARPARDPQAAQGATPPAAPPSPA